MQLGVTKMVTGHNADDIAETVIMNILRGDIARLRRWASHIMYLQVITSIARYSKEPYLATRSICYCL